MGKLDVQIKLGDDEMKEVIAEALLKEMTPEKRDEIIAVAIRSLITIENRENRYGSKVSPIQEAFNTAVRQVAFQIATEMVSENAQIRQKMESLIAEATARLFSDEEREKLVNNLSVAIGRAITGDRY